MQAMHARSAELARPILQRQVELRKAVRQVNEQFSTSIVSRLPETSAKAFERLYRQRGFPTVYRSTPTQRHFKVALELAQANATLVHGITDLETAYLSELDPMNEQLRQAVIAHEADELLEQGEKRLFGEKGRVDPSTSGLAEVRSRRQDLDRRYHQQLLSILPSEMASLVAGVTKPISEP
jgi:hypothetical protein